MRYYELLHVRPDTTRWIPIEDDAERDYELCQVPVCYVHVLKYGAYGCRDERESFHQALKQKVQKQADKWVTQLRREPF